MDGQEVLVALCNKGSRQPFRASCHARPVNPYKARCTIIWCHEELCQYDACSLVIADWDYSHSTLYLALNR
jgi:hypothetical protein